MGGNAFSLARRIRREEIRPTLAVLCQRLAMPGLTVDYCMANLAGSCGKQETSGDVDVLLDREIFGTNFLRHLADHAKPILGEAAVDDVHLRTTSDELHLLVPIYGPHGRPEGPIGSAFAQVDFIVGKLDWLRFITWSPGGDVSPYPGVFIATTLMALCKMQTEFRLRDHHGPVAGVTKMIDKIRGLYRSWSLRTQPGQLPGLVDPDYWETHVPIANPPRFARIGYIDDPDEVIRMVLGQDVTRADLETFERFWTVIAAKSARGALPPAMEIKERVITNLLDVAPLRRQYGHERLVRLPVWSNDPPNV